MKNNKQIIVEAQENARCLSNLGQGVVFYEREGSVIVRDPEKLVMLLQRLHRPENGE